jgi:hypothetical protein
MANKKREKTGNDLHNTMQKTKDLANNMNTTEHRRELMCFESVNSSCSTKGPNHVVLVKNPMVSDERGKEIEMFDIYNIFNRFTAIFNLIVFVNKCIN